MKTSSIFSFALALLSATALASNQQTDRVAELKEQIKSVATEATATDRDLLATKNELSPLVNELVAISPSQTEAQKAELVAGGWVNLWTDNNFGPTLNPANIYQVVSADGYYYNISEIPAATGKLTNFLRGAYTDEGSYLAIEFTANSVSNVPLTAGTDLTALANKVEQSLLATTPVRGPVGVTGVLLNVYVDDDLRIVWGNSTLNSRPLLFILERTETVLERTNTTLTR